MNYVKKKSRTLSGSQFYSLDYGCLCLVAKSCVRLFCSPPGFLVHKDFPKQDYWRKLSFPPQSLPDLGIKPTSSALTGGFLYY